MYKKVSPQYLTIQEFINNVKTTQKDLELHKIEYAKDYVKSTTAYTTVMDYIRTYALNRKTTHREAIRELANKRLNQIAEEELVEWAAEYGYLTREAIIEDDMDEHAALMGGYQTIPESVENLKNFYIDLYLSHTVDRPEALKTPSINPFLSYQVTKDDIDFDKLSEDEWKQQIAQKVKNSIHGVTTAIDLDVMDLRESMKLESEAVCTIPNYKSQMFKQTPSREDDYVNPHKSDYSLVDQQ